MSKSDYEVAGEITQELIRARGVVLSGADSSRTAAINYVNTVLTAEQIAEAYSVILQAVRKGFNG
ncbi:MAG TPA: hypothetical protein VGI33_02565 [Paenibacillus sp.]|jgi:hypothetical protein